MDVNIVRSRVLATLNPDANVRRAAELELKQVCLSLSNLVTPLEWCATCVGQTSYRRRRCCSVFCY